MKHLIFYLLVCCTAFAQNNSVKKEDTVLNNAKIQYNSNGYKKVTNNSKFGVVDSTGVETIPSIYDQMGFLF